MTLATAWVSLCRLTLGVSCPRLALTRNHLRNTNFAIAPEVCHPPRKDFDIMLTANKIAALKTMMVLPHERPQLPIAGNDGQSPPASVKEEPMCSPTQSGTTTMRGDLVCLPTLSSPITMRGDGTRSPTLSDPTIQREGTVERNLTHMPIREKKRWSPQTASTPTRAMGLLSSIDVNPSIALENKAEFL